MAVIDKGFWLVCSHMTKIPWSVLVLYGLVCGPGWFSAVSRSNSSHSMGEWKRKNLVYRRHGQVFV